MLYCGSQRARTLYLEEVRIVMPVSVSINELKEKYPDELIELTLENFSPKASLNVSPQGGNYQVSILVWGNDGVVASGQLNNANGSGEWKLEELAQALGVSSDEKAWVMNDRI